jgi:hypothetical protein
MYVERMPEMPGAFHHTAGVHVIEETGTANMSTKAAPSTDSPGTAQQICEQMLANVEQAQHFSLHAGQGSVKAPSVAACTAKAAHARDHDHAVEGQRCHPHLVKVVYLGHRALTVCHDCRADSGFLPYREAERLAEVHRVQTLGARVLLTAAATS